MTTFATMFVTVYVIMQQYVKTIAVTDMKLSEWTGHGSRLMLLNLLGNSTLKCVAMQGL